MFQRLRLLYHAILMPAYAFGEYDDTPEHMGILKSLLSLVIEYCRRLRHHTRAYC